jgi:hypothetical protein
LRAGRTNPFRPAWSGRDARASRECRPDALETRGFRRGDDLVEHGDGALRLVYAGQGMGAQQIGGRAIAPRPSRIFPVSGLDEVHGLKEVDLRFERETMIGA